MFLKVLRKGSPLTKNYPSSAEHSPEKTLFCCQFLLLYSSLRKGRRQLFRKLLFLSSSGMLLLLELAAQSNPCSFSVDFQPTPHVLR